jgi:hypothetical protein
VAEAEPRLSIGRVAELTECLNLITFKIRLYEACRAEGLADPLLTPEEDLGAH